LKLNEYQLQKELFKKTEVPLTQYGYDTIYLQSGVTEYDT